MNDRKYIYYCYFLFFFFVFCIKKSYSLVAKYYFCAADKLTNGNFLIITLEYIILLDSSFKLISNIYSTSILDCYYWDSYMTHFSEEEGGYVIFISSLHSRQYIFSPDGQLLT